MAGIAEQLGESRVAWGASRLFDHDMLTFGSGLCQHPGRRCSSPGEFSHSLPKGLTTRVELMLIGMSGLLLTSDYPRQDPARAATSSRLPAGTRSSIPGGGHSHPTCAGPGSEPAAIRRAEAILRGVGPLQNQHLMGWGALNPEPKPGEYDWKSLDDRVDFYAPDRRDARDHLVRRRTG